MTSVLKEIAAWFSMPVLGVLAVVMVWRKAYRQYLFFLVYVVLGELTGLTRFLVHGFLREAYFQTYWISDALLQLFAFLTAYELFVKRLFIRFYEIRFYRYAFMVAAMGLGLIAVPAMLQAKKVNVLLAGIHTVEVLRVMVLIFFVGLMIFMGRRWTRYEFGIALGLGIQASVLLITSTIWTKSPLNVVSTWLPVIAYNIACLIWLITFLKPETPTTAPARPISPELLTEARKWQEAAKGSLTTKKDSE